MARKKQELTEQSLKTAKKAALKDREKSGFSNLRNYVVTAISNVNGSTGNATVMVNGQHYHLPNKSADQIAEIIAAAQQLEQSDSEADYQSLMGLLRPNSTALSTAGVTVDKGNVYLGQVPIPVPEKLGKHVLDYLQKGYPVTAYERFWALLCLNPDKRLREDIIKFVFQHGITITSGGQMLLYKAVTTKKIGKKGEDLRDTVAERYLAVKRQRKSPKNFVVYRLPDGSLKVHESYKKGQLLLPAGKAFDEGNYSNLGNLDSLHSSISYLDTDTVYTDKWTKKMDIMLGVPVKQARHLCDPDPDRGCSRGLHAGGYSYVYSYANSDDTVLLALLNPMNLVAVPRHDNRKVRCCEYYPLAIVERGDDGHWTELDSPYFEEDYFDYQKDDLIKQINALKKDLKEEMVNLHNANATTIDGSDILETTLVDLKGRTGRRGKPTTAKKTVRKRTTTAKKTTTRKRKTTGKGSRKKKTTT